MENLKDRTKKFALDVVRLCALLPHKPEIQIITRQLMRSATSVAANYRAACRGKSKADFICKLSTVEEEADESMFWLEMLLEIYASEKEKLTRLQNEASQLVAIMVSSNKTARSNRD
jgi:four helix bundle protein